MCVALKSDIKFPNVSVCREYTAKFGGGPSHYLRAGWAVAARPGASGVEVPLVGWSVVAGGDIARGEGVGDGTAERRRRWLPAGPLHLPSTAQPHLHQAPGLPPASMYIHNYNYYNHLTASFPGRPG